MTQPGPGPYGGHPGGGPPHGYPQAPGGPPHGYPGGPAGPGGPPPSPPKKKSNAPLFIAIGCGALLVLSGAGVAAAYFFVYRPAQRALEQLPDIASAFPSGFPMPPLPPPAGPAPGVEPALPSDSNVAGSAATPGGARSPGSSVGGATAQGGTTGAAGAATGGGAGTEPVAANPSCAQAVRCCRLIVSRSPAGGTAASNCDGLKLLNEAICKQQLQTYSQAAKLLGTSCD